MNDYKSMPEEELKIIQRTISKNIEDVYKEFKSKDFFLKARNDYKILKMELKEIYSYLIKEKNQNGGIYYQSQFNPFISDIYLHMCERTNSSSKNNLIQCLAEVIGYVDYYSKGFLNN